MLLFAAISLISLLCMAFFISALVSVVKLKETLDNVKFSKAVATFPKYVIKVFSWLLIFSAVSIAIGVLLDFAGAPSMLTHFILFLIWLPFIFTPQVLIIEDFGITESLSDSFRFVKKAPVALAAYLVAGFVFLILLTALETILGQYFVWEHKIFSIVILYVFVLPYLMMFATQLYIKRYPVSHV
jgi:hypothetical protein